jgi:hypothetical protein
MAASTSTEMSTNTTTTFQRFGKTRDSMTRHNFLQNTTSWTTTRPSLGGYGNGNDDFTNVTGFSHFISTVDPKRLACDNDDIDLEDEDDFANEKEKHESRTILQMQEPPSLSLFDYSKKDATDESYQFNRPTQALATAGCTTMVLSPSNKVDFLFFLPPFS